MSFNVFDFDESEETKKFEKNVIFGTNEESSTSHKDFMKKSLVAANMNVGSFDDYRNTEIEKPRSGSLGLSARGQGNTSALSRPTFETTRNEPSPKASLENRTSIRNETALSSRNSPVSSSRSEPKIASKSSPGMSAKMEPQYSIDDVLELAPQISALDYKRLQDDLTAAKQTIERLKKQKWTSIPVEETMKRIITGDPYTLDAYKSLQEKERLLEKAILSKDGNAIITVVIFLERTLSAHIFHQQMKKNPIAMNHFVQHLRSSMFDETSNKSSGVSEDWKKLYEFYKVTGHIVEAAFLQYEQANHITDVTQRIIELQKWLNTYMDARQPEIEEIRSYITDEIKLLEKQNQIEAEDKKRDQYNANAVVERISVERCPLIATLSYCALYHNRDGDQHNSAELRKQFQVTDKQYEWAVLTPLAKLKDYVNMEKLLTSSSWFGKKSEVSHIGFENVVAVMLKTNCAQDKIIKYANLIPNLETRVKCGREFQLHDVVIDALFQLKDRGRLQQYRQFVGSPHQERITTMLNNSSIKWK